MKWQILVDGRPVEIDGGRLEAVVQVEPGVYSVIVDGVSHEVRLQASPEGLQAESEGRRLVSRLPIPATPGAGRRPGLARGVKTSWRRCRGK